MGAILIKYLESARADNRGLFCLDNGEKDLAALYQDKTIAVGSIAICPTNGAQWYLNSKRRWIKTVINLETLILDENAALGDELDIDIPEIKSVDISPSLIDAVPGSHIQFNVNVDGANRATEDAIWTIAPNKNLHKDTRISQDGLLSIALGQKKSKIEIQALSRDNLTTFGSAEVMVDNAFSPLDPKVTGIVISPKVLSQKPNKSVKFKAHIAGRNVSNEEVKWTIIGATDSFIDDNGKISIGGNETATAFIVQAAYKDNPSIFDYATVIIESSVSNPSALSVIPQGVQVKRGTRLSLLGKLDNKESNQEIDWVLRASGKPGTKISFNGILSVDPEETLTSIKVRAISCQNPEVYSDVNFNVMDELDDGSKRIDAVAFIKKHSRVQKNGSASFLAMAVGKNLETGLVDYSIKNNTSPATRILKNGILSVAVEEQAKSLIVTATSVEDPTKKDVVVVVIPQFEFEGGQGTGGGIPEVDPTPANTYYVRGINAEGHPEWRDIGDYGFLTDAPTHEPDAIYVRKTVDGHNVWEKADSIGGFVSMTKEEWNDLPPDERPEYANITDYWLAPNRLKILTEDGKLI